MDDQTDTALVRQALAGQKKAFADLVAKYQDYAYGTAVAIVSDFDLARDVVQESFLAAYRDLRKLREPAKFPGWLRRIVRNMAYRALRELKRVRALAGGSELVAEPMDTGLTPDLSAEEAERRRIVRGALGRLNEKNREAVSLYYVDGLSYAQIATFVGVTETTVRGRLHRGRAELRKELTMVAKTLEDEHLPEDFSDEIRSLLDAAAEPGEHTDAVRRLVEMGGPAVDPLCAALEDRRVAVRKAAARILCDIGDPRALRPLLRVLYAKDWQAGNAILRTGRALTVPGFRQELLRIVREGTHDQKYWAIQALAHAKADDEVHDALYKLFHGPRSGVQRQALWALCKIRPESGLDRVTEAFRDGGPGLRTAAGWTALVGGFLPPIDACLKAFSRRVRPNARATAGILILQHGDEGKRVLEELLTSGSTVQRISAALALAQHKHPGAFEVLRDALRDRSLGQKMLQTLSRTIAWCYGPALVEWIRDEKPDLTGAHALVWSLARSGVGEADEMTERLLRTGTPSVRSAALRILSQRKGAAFLPELRRHVREDPSPKVIQEACRQMFRLREAAEPAVLAMLESEHWRERRAALCMLRRWGKLTAAQQARGRKDPHVAVRHAADRHPDYHRAAADLHPKWKRRIEGTTP